MDLNTIANPATPERNAMAARAASRASASPADANSAFATQLRANLGSDSSSADGADAAQAQPADGSDRDGHSKAEDGSQPDPSGINGLLDQWHAQQAPAPDANGDAARVQAAASAGQGTPHDGTHADGSDSSTAAQDKPRTAAVGARRRAAGDAPMAGALDKRLATGHGAQGKPAADAAADASKGVADGRSGSTHAVAGDASQQSAANADAGTNANAGANALGADGPRNRAAAEGAMQSVSAAAGKGSEQAQGRIGGIDQLRADGLGAAAGAMLAPATHDAPSVRVDIATPVQSPEFREVLSAQIATFTRGDIQEATLHLNPADMGPITVQIAVEGSKATVDFQAGHAATRALIESSLPSLASALKAEGLTLAGGSVGGQTPQSGGDGGNASSGRSPGGEPARSVTLDARTVSGSAASRSAGRSAGSQNAAVDLYA